MIAESVSIPGRNVREDFERDGYLVFDPQIPAALLDAVVADVGPLFNDSRDGVMCRSGAVLYEHRVQDAFLVSEAVRKVAVWPAIMALLGQIYRRKPFCFQTLNFRVGTQQALHSDTIHFNSDPAGYMCGVWLALEDVDAGNGPLMYLPGSHRWPEITMKEVGAPSSAVGYPRYERYIAQMARDRGVEPRLGLIRKGQALLWAANLLHGGSPIRDAGRTRLSQVSHYFFEDCAYYTPMLSTDERRFLRQPTRLYEDRLVQPWATRFGRYRAIAAATWRGWRTRN